MSRRLIQVATLVSVLFLRLPSSYAGGAIAPSELTAALNLLKSSPEARVALGKLWRLDLVSANFDAEAVRSKIAERMSAVPLPPEFKGMASQTGGSKEKVTTASRIAGLSSASRSGSSSFVQTSAAQDEAAGADSGINPEISTHDEAGLTINIHPHAETGEARLIAADPAVIAYLSARGLKEVTISEVRHVRAWGGYTTATSEVVIRHRRYWDGTVYDGSDWPMDFYVTVRPRPTADGSHYYVTD